jgi:hypothetical protein
MSSMDARKGFDYFEPNAVGVATTSRSATASQPYKAATTNGVGTTPTLKFETMRSKSDVVPEIQKWAAAALGLAGSIVPNLGEMGSMFINPTDHAYAAPAELLPNGEEGEDAPPAIWAGSAWVAQALGIPLYPFSALEREAVQKVAGDQGEEPSGGSRVGRTGQPRGVPGIQEELVAEADDEGDEGAASPSTPVRSANVGIQPTRTTARQAAAAQAATPGGGTLRGLSAGETVRNSKNTALTQELRRHGIRVATMLRSSYPATVKAIKDELNHDFKEVPLDNLPADTAIQIGRSIEDNQMVFDAISASVKAAARAGSKWARVVAANLSPGVIDVAAARMIKAKELNPGSLSQFEKVYGLFPVTAVIVALINRDFHASYNDSSNVLTLQLREALELDESGAPDLVATDLRIRTLVGTHTHNRELISYNGITESLARLIVSADKLHPTTMYPRLQGAWLEIYDKAADILTERSEDKVKQFDEARYYLIGDGLEAIARDILTIQCRRELVGSNEAALTRTVSLASSEHYASARCSGWGDDDEHEFYGETHAASVAPTNGVGPKAETIPCEYGCGTNLRRDNPWCHGCGGHKTGSWVCLSCNRVNPSSDPACRNRHQGCDSIKAVGRPVDTNPGSADAKRGLRILELRKLEWTRMEGNKSNKMGRQPAAPSAETGKGGKGGKGAGKGAARAGPYYGSGEGGASRPGRGRDLPRLAN